MERTTPRWSGIVTGILGALWLAVFPLWNDLSYAHITRAKWLGALVLCGVTIAACIVICIVLACKGQLRGALRWHPVQLIALGYFAWVVLSAWQGKWADAVNGSEQLVVWMGAIRYEGLHIHLCYAMIFLMLSLFPPRMNIVLPAAAAALVLFCGIAAVQYTGANVLGLFPAGRSIYTNYEFQSTIGNIDMVSGYLSLMVPLLLGSFAIREKGCWYLLAAGTLGAAMMWCIDVQSGLIALMLLCGLLVLLGLRFPAWRCRICLALAGVMAGLALRGMLFLPWLDSATPREVQPILFVFGKKALLGLIAAALLILLSALFRRHPGKAMPARAILCLVLAGAVLLLAAVILLPIPQSGGALYELHESLNGRMQDHFGSWRMGAWRHSIHMSKESPLFGNGPDTFFYALKDHLTREAATLGENYDNPHNEYVAILVNNGIPALVLYLALLATALIACCRRKLWPLAFSIGCFAAQGFFSFSICLVSPMFWAIMGMAAAHYGKPLHIEHNRAIIEPEVNDLGTEL